MAAPSRLIYLIRNPPCKNTQASDQPEPASNEIENNDFNSDAPAWAHHSEVDQTLLTPMLRHYVELKAEHPERVPALSST